MIDYSVNVTTPSLSEGRKIPRAIPQVRAHLTTEELAEHIAAHGSKYNAGDIAAVIFEVAKCVKEEVLAGNKVDVASLGSFTADLDSTNWKATADDGSARTPDKFTADDIHGVTLRWEKPAHLRNLRREAQLNFVPSRKKQAAVNAEEKTSLGRQGSTAGGQV